MDPIRKSSRFAYRPLINPPPSLSKISYKYNSMLTYIPVSFLFSFIFRVRVKNRVWVRVSFRLGLAFRFGIGNQIVIICGAAGTVDPCGRKTLVPCLVVYFGVFLLLLNCLVPFY